MMRLRSFSGAALSRFPLTTPPTPRLHGRPRTRDSRAWLDLHKHLVQTPSPQRVAAHLRHPLLSDLGGEHRTKPIPPNRTVSWLMSIPRSASRSSTLRSDGGISHTLPPDG